MGDLVAKAVRVVRASGLPNRTDAMFTTIEGEWDEVMAVISRCHEHLAKDSGRVVCTVKMDWRKGHSGRLEGKVRSVEQKLGRTLST